MTSDTSGIDRNEISGSDLCNGQHSPDEDMAVPAV